MLDDTGLPTWPHKSQLKAYLDEVIAFIGESPLDDALEARLNAEFGPASVAFREMTRLLRIGINEGWACYNVIDGDNYRRGRLANSHEGTHEFAIESARLKDVKGNYHTHMLAQDVVLGRHNQSVRIDPKTDRPVREGRRNIVAIALKADQTSGRYALAQLDEAVKSHG